MSGITSERVQFQGWQNVNLTLLRKDLIDADRVITRAIARNETAQNEAWAYNEESSAIGIAVTNARLAVVEAYTEYGISEGRAGAIFRFTDSGEDAVTYNISLIALNKQADANLTDFKNLLAGIVNTLHSDIETAVEARVSALATSEDERFESADTDSQEQQIRSEWENAENLRSRIIMFDKLIFLAAIDSTQYANDGFVCRFDSDGYRVATGVGRDAYIRKYWHKEQPLDRTYTKERLSAVEGVLNNLEQWLQERIDYWESQGRDGEYSLQRCEIRCMATLSEMAGRASGSGGRRLWLRRRRCRSSQDCF